MSKMSYKKHICMVSIAAASVVMFQSVSCMNFIREQNNRQVSAAGNAEPLYYFSQISRPFAYEKLQTLDLEIVNAVNELKAQYSSAIEAEYFRFKKAVLSMFVKGLIKRFNMLNRNYFGTRHKKWALAKHGNITMGQPDEEETSTESSEDFSWIKRPLQIEDSVVLKSNRYYNAAIDCYNSLIDKQFDAFTSVVSINIPKNLPDSEVFELAKFLVMKKYTQIASAVVEKSQSVVFNCFEKLFPDRFKIITEQILAEKLRADEEEVENFRALEDEMLEAEFQVTKRQILKEKYDDIFYQKTYSYFKVAYDALRIGLAQVKKNFKNCLLENFDSIELPDSIDKGYFFSEYKDKLDKILVVDTPSIVKKIAASEQNFYLNMLQNPQITLKEFNELLDKPHIDCFWQNGNVSFKENIKIALNPSILECKSYNNIAVAFLCVVGTIIDNLAANNISFKVNFDNETDECVVKDNCCIIGWKMFFEECGYLTNQLRYTQKYELPLFWLKELPKTQSFHPNTCRTTEVQMWFHQLGVITNLLLEASFRKPDSDFNLSMRTFDAPDWWQKELFIHPDSVIIGGEIKKMETLKDIQYIKELICEYSFYSDVDMFQRIGLLFMGDYIIVNSNSDCISNLELRKPLQLWDFHNPSSVRNVQNILMQSSFMKDTDLNTEEILQLYKDSMGLICYAIQRDFKYQTLEEILMLHEKHPIECKRYIKTACAKCE